LKERRGRGSSFFLAGRNGLPPQFLLQVSQLSDQASGCCSARLEAKVDIFLKQPPYVVSLGVRKKIGAAVGGPDRDRLVEDRLASGVEM
jgi:hypothetical protein